MVIVPPILQDPDEATTMRKLLSELLEEVRRSLEAT